MKLPLYTQDSTDDLYEYMESVREAIANDVNQCPATNMPSSESEYVNVRGRTWSGHSRGSSSRHSSISSKSSINEPQVWNFYAIFL